MRSTTLTGRMGLQCMHGTWDTDQTGKQQKYWKLKHSICNCIYFCEHIGALSRGIVVVNEILVLFSLNTDYIFLVFLLGLHCVSVFLAWLLVLGGC